VLALACKCRDSSAHLHNGVVIRNGGEVRSAHMDLSHIAMHVSLCNAVAQASAARNVPLRVQVTDKLDRPQVQQTFQIQPGMGKTPRFEFDLPFGIYRIAMQAKAGNATCGAVEYFTVLTGHNRSLDVTLQNGRVTNPVVPMLVAGESPFSFAYVQPTLMLFGKTAKCDGPVGDPINADIHVTTDSDGYYAQIFPNSALAQAWPVVVAMQMKDSQGGYHYVRLPGEPGFSRWPSQLSFNVSEDVIDYVADKPEDTLLCPRMYKTTVH
jgi:hypothetical protein